MKNLYQVNVSEDRAFQKTFNGYYRVRRNTDWQEIFYQLFEECKYREDLTFAYILRYIYRETGRIEASFSSKLLATIDHSMPIWDSIVLSNLGLKNPGRACEEKVEKTIKLYEKIRQWYQEFSGTAEAKQCIEVFDDMFPELTYFTEIKKLDFMIWATRDSEHKKEMRDLEISGTVTVPAEISVTQVQEEIEKLFHKKKWFFNGTVENLE